MWKKKIGCVAFQGTNKWNGIFQLKMSKLKVIGLQKPQKTHLITGGRSEHVDPIAAPLLGLIYCQHLNMRCSATGWTATWRVGTQQRHAFLLHFNASLAAPSESDESVLSITDPSSCAHQLNTGGGTHSLFLLGLVDCFSFTVLAATRTHRVLQYVRQNNAVWTLS